METREFKLHFMTFFSYKLTPQPEGSISSIDINTFSHSPLHLAIIHQQTGVIQQLIHTLLSSHQQNTLNAANHLQQVTTPSAFTNTNNSTQLS